MILDGDRRGWANLGRSSLGATDRRADFAMSMLFIGTNGTVSAIDIATGGVGWTTSLSTGEFFVSTAHQDVSVLAHDGTVFAGCMGHLFCLDAESGRILWHNPLSGMGHNDISLAVEGVSIQYLEKVVHTQSP